MRAIAHFIGDSVRSVAGALRSSLAILTIATGATAFGGPPIPLNLSPIAVRGGIVAIPLQLPPAGEGLPSSVPVQLRDGDRASEIIGRVVWLATPMAAREPHWTRSANPTVVRTIEEETDPRSLVEAAAPQRVRSIDAALLLVDVPDVSERATLALGAAVVSPVWIAAGPSLEVGQGDVSIDPEMGVEWSDDRPDPESPFEWFRWTLIAKARGERVPAPPGDAASQLFARHVAELWLAGIDRIQRQSEGVADSLRQWLTSTSVGAPSGTSTRTDAGGAAAGKALATWVADPGELGSLLGILLDRNRSDAAVMNAVLAWMDARTPLMLWIESDSGGVVRMAVANPMNDELVVKVQWLGETLAPLATLLAPRSIGHMAVDRPAARLVDPASGEGIVLAVQAENVARRFTFAPRAVQAKPPSLAFGTFVAPLTLAEVQGGRIGSVPPEWGTAASVRRRAGHWEIFAECLAPKDGPRDDAFTIEVRGRSLTVRRDGTVDGERDALLETSIREFEDRWRLRVTLPDSWMPKPGAPGGVITMGMARDVGTVHTTAVLPRASFERRLPLVEVDLSAWTDGLAPRDADGAR